MKVLVLVPILSRFHCIVNVIIRNVDMSRVRGIASRECESLSDGSAGSEWHLRRMPPSLRRGSLRNYGFLTPKYHPSTQGAVLYMLAPSPLPWSMALMLFAAIPLT
jgi:hypothetical protein